MAPFADIISRAEDLYVPSALPLSTNTAVLMMSPLTTSCFLCDSSNAKNDRLGSMGNVYDIIRHLVPVAGVALLFCKHREVGEALEAFKNNFPRGGPPTPMHPSPAGDDALLRPNESR